VSACAIHTFRIVVDAAQPEANDRPNPQFVHFRHTPAAKGPVTP
jgi:hypothetical protein